MCMIELLIGPYSKVQYPPPFKNLATVLAFSFVVHHNKVFPTSWCPREGGSMEHPLRKPFFPAEFCDEYYICLYTKDNHI